MPKYTVLFAQFMEISKVSVLFFSSTAAPLTGELRCQCIQTVSEAILHRHIASVLLLPEGPHCEVSEVM